MSRDSIYEVFRKRDAMLVHCSSFQPLVGSDFTSKFTPLERLHYAIANTPEVSCSTIKYGDTFENRNFTGKLGVIVDPRSLDDITFIWPEDGGTEAKDEEGQPRGKYIQGLEISPNSLLKAIDERPLQQHNEICAQNFDVRGIFFSDPIQFNQEGPPFLVNHSIEEIIVEFDGQPIYQLHQGRLFKTFLNSGKVEREDPIRIADIYNT